MYVLLVLLVLLPLPLTLPLSIDRVFLGVFFSFFSYDMLGIFSALLCAVQGSAREMDVFFPPAYACCTLFRLLLCMSRDAVHTASDDGGHHN